MNNSKRYRQSETCADKQIQTNDYSIAELLIMGREQNHIELASPLRIQPDDDFEPEQKTAQG